MINVLKEIIMSKNKESWFDKFIKFINLKDDKIIKEDLKPISKTAQKIVICIHIIFISMFFLKSLIFPYENWPYLFACLYLTGALIFVAYKTKNRITFNINRSIKIILLSTILALLVGFITYHTPFGEALEIKELNVFFEQNKIFLGKEYYSIYLNNKDNLTELKILRDIVKEDINI